MLKIAVIVGTRPEAIKLAPVILNFKENPSISLLVVNTGQHRELCLQALETFSIVPDIDLDVMISGQSLGQLTGGLFHEIDQFLENNDLDWVVVQGDTVSAMVGAISAFYRKIKIAHVEAGLRSYDILAPFPEEINRIFISQVATKNFAPTEGSQLNLSRSGIAAEKIIVTGNTIVDAVRILKPKLKNISVSSFLSQKIINDLKDKRLLLVTSHRRESFGQGIKDICQSLEDLVAGFPDLVIIYPVHPNPNIRDIVLDILKGKSRIHLIEPLEYTHLMTLVERSTLILTDSGGLQEEVPSFKKPLLILRDVTERPEVVESGFGILVGTNASKIFEKATDFLSDPDIHKKMENLTNPFGDGYAANRITNEMMKP